MDQFGIELDHGEIALDLTENEDKFSPRRTRSGRVFETKSARRRHRHSAQESDRSRNSSGQSGTGSLDDSSENDECLGEMNSEEEKGVKKEGAMEKEQEGKKNEKDEKKASEDDPEYVKTQNDVINNISEATIHDLYESPLTNKDETLCLNDYFWQIHRSGLTATKGAMGKGLSTNEVEYFPPSDQELWFPKKTFQGKRVYKLKRYIFPSYPIEPPKVRNFSNF